MRVLEKPFLGGCSSSESVWISKKEKQQVRDPSEWVQLLHTRKNGTYEGLYARSEGCHGRKCDTYGQRGRMDREAARMEERHGRRSDTDGGAACTEKWHERWTGHAWRGGQDARPPPVNNPYYSTAHTTRPLAPPHARPPLPYVLHPRTCRPLRVATPTSSAVECLCPLPEVVGKMMGQHRLLLLLRAAALLYFGLKTQTIDQHTQ